MQRAANHTRCPCSDVTRALHRALSSLAWPVKQVAGSANQAIGKAAGDKKLEAEGTAQKVEGKVQSAVGGLKDTLKGK